MLAWNIHVITSMVLARRDYLNWLTSSDECHRVWFPLLPDDNVHLHYMLLTVFYLYLLTYVLYMFKIMKWVVEMYDSNEVKMLPARVNCIVILDFKVLHQRNVLYLLRQWFFSFFYAAVPLILPKWKKTGICFS